MSPLKNQGTNVMDKQTQHKMSAVFAEQKKLFLSGATQSNTFKKAQLLKLKEAVNHYRTDLRQAMAVDLGRSEEGVDRGEIQPLLNEIDFALIHLDEWTQEQCVPTPSELSHTRSFISREGYGVTYIISPFNYPVYLTGGPLVGAIVGGNTAMIKPSESTPETSKVIENIINNTFDPAYAHVFQGAREENEYLLSLPFDLIFFTGSPQVGKIVMAAAAKNLTPVLLELGGKCPAIVLADADLDQAVQELVGAKMFNSGQTCVAPDYIYADKRIKESLVSKLSAALKADYHQAGSNGKIITEQAWNRLENIVATSKGKVLRCGDADKTQRYFSPIVIDDADFDDSSMQGELFGPIFPVLTFENESEIATNVNTRHPKPLAAYVFTVDPEHGRELIDAIPSGDASINTLMMHASTPWLPFGGVGPSGMGSYHGKYSYEAFTHQKSIRVKKVVKPA
nr:aldehyde dehydrogenase family protein [Pantoea coffeiphila]